MVSSTGTLVKRLSTSKEAMVPVDGESRKRRRNSDEDFTRYSLGIYGVNMVFSFLASL